MGACRPFFPSPCVGFAAWCVVVLLVAGVFAVGVWLFVVLQTAVTPVLLALLGTALLGPLYRRLLRMKVNGSLAAAAHRVAVVTVVGGATYIVVLALIETGDQIVDSLRQAGTDIAKHLGAAGTSLEDLAKNAKDLLGEVRRHRRLRRGQRAQRRRRDARHGPPRPAADLLLPAGLRPGRRAAALPRPPRRPATLMEAMARRAFEAVEGFMRGTTFVAFVDAV